MRTSIEKTMKMIDSRDAFNQNQKGSKGTKTHKKGTKRLPKWEPKRHKDHEKESLRTSIEKTMKINDSMDAFGTHLWSESMENPLEIQLKNHQRIKREKTCN